MTGDRRSSQASASWTGLKPDCRASSASGPPGLASCPVAIGQYGMKPRPSRSQ